MDRYYYFSPNLVSGDELKAGYAFARNLASRPEKHSAFRRKYSKITPDGACGLSDLRKLSKAINQPSDKANYPLTAWKSLKSF